MGARRRDRRHNGVRVPGVQPCRRGALTMSELLRLGTGIMLLLITLSLALSYLSPYIKLARRSGLPRAARKTALALGRLTFRGFRRILGRIPRRIRPLRRRA